MAGLSGKGWQSCSDFFALNNDISFIKGLIIMQLIHMYVYDYSFIQHP